MAARVVDPAALDEQVRPDYRAARYLIALNAIGEKAGALVSVCALVIIINKAAI